MAESTAILLIDDDESLCAMLSEYLLPEGVDVASVNRGDVGLERATADTWDVIILDVMLPGMSGFDVLRGLRGRQIMTPVLMLTARGTDVDRIVGLELGADDYLPKPFNPRELIARIRAILRRGPPQGVASETLLLGPYCANLKQRTL